jgi:hypothetical protein
MRFHALVTTLANVNLTRDVPGHLLISEAAAARGSSLAVMVKGPAVGRNECKTIRRRPM